MIEQKHSSSTKKKYQTHKYTINALNLCYVMVSTEHNLQFYMNRPNSVLYNSETGSKYANRIM